MIERRYYGKYRGKVQNNVDSEGLGRIEVYCDAVFGRGNHNLAMPSVPFAGQGTGFVFIPPVDSSVWVEFEQGDPSKPIWSGGFWERFQGPDMPALPPKGMPMVGQIKTHNMSITLDETPGAGGVTIEVKATYGVIPMTIKCDAQGIHIQQAGATLDLAAPSSVRINDGAIEVM